MSTLLIIAWSIYGALILVTLGVHTLTRRASQPPLLLHVLLVRFLA